MSCAGRRVGGQVVTVDWPCCSRCACRTIVFRSSPPQKRRFKIVREVKCRSAFHLRHDDNHSICMAVMPLEKLEIESYHTSTSTSIIQGYYVVSF